MRSLPDIDLSILLSEVFKYFVIKLKTDAVVLLLPVTLLCWQQGQLLVLPVRLPNKVQASQDPDHTR